MNEETQLLVIKRIDENKDFFLSYLRSLRKNKYFSTKSPEILFESYQSKVSRHFWLQDFTVLISTFIDFMFEETEDKIKKSDLLFLNKKSKELFSEERLNAINRSLNDLYSINATMSRVAYLKIVLDYEATLISDIVGIPLDSVMKELDLSKAFILGWIIRDQNLEQKIAPFVGEQGYIDFFFPKGIRYESTLDEEEDYSQEIEKVINEIDHQILGIKEINSRLTSMTSLVNSKINN